MSTSEIFHADWCRSMFSMLAENGRWAVPRSGLIFQKQGDTLKLIATMPHDPSMPLPASQLAVVQAADFEVIRRHFQEAGITVTRESTCPSCGRKGEPVETIRAAERITFYGCPGCDFSTWERGEFY